MQGLGEDDEESKGAFIALNDDDDDDNHTKDLDETGITGEDNVIAASLSAAGAPAVDGKVELLISAGTGNIKVWDSATKDNQILPRGTPVKYYKTWDISSFPSTVYVEGIGASSVRGAELKWSYIKVLDNDVNCTVHTDKVKITVVDVVSIAVDTSDTKTHKIDSVLAEAQIPDDHFVTAKGAGDIVLKATISPSTDETKNVITWTNMTQDPTDKLKATKSRATSDKYPGTVNVSGATARSFTNWVVWSTPSPGPNPISKVLLANKKVVSGGYDVTFTINPGDIITQSDRPNLSGPKTDDPPDVPSGDTGVANKGVSLAGGADKKWDNSRQIRRKVINPDGIVFDPALHDITKYTTYLNYPSDDVCGNDDKTVGDPEDNDPYTAPYSGAVYGYDNPTRSPYHSEGDLNNTFEIRNHMRAFARLNIGGKWYRISDGYLWKTDFKFKKRNESEATHGMDFNDDGDMLDTVPVWGDNGSVIALDNSGF